MSVRKMRLSVWLYCTVLFFGLRCLNPKLNELEFFSVDTNSYTVLGIDSFQANGLLTGLTNAQVDTCGFVWSDDLTAISGAQPAGNITVAGEEVGNGLFKANLPAKQGGVIYFRAFAWYGERQMYSETIESFSLANIVEMAGTITVDNNTALVYGFLSDIENLNLPIEAHGHVYAAGNPLPEISGPGCDTVNLGTAKIDGLYQSKLDSLEFNQPYFVRAYVISQGKAYYSSIVGTFSTRDGWEQIDSFPTYYQEGLAVMDTWREKAYAGFGCKIESGCKAAQLTSEIWEFDPDGMVGAWSPTMPMGSVTERTNASGFVIGDTLYLLFGEQIGDFGGVFTILSFRKFHLPSMTWLPPPAPPPPDMLPRTGAVAFVLDKKGYAGAGRNVDIAFSDTWLSDVWEYTPGTGSWRKVATLPELGPPGLPNNGGSREEAAVFAFEHHAVVGGGRRGVLYLRDFWKFIPPLSPSPQDSGQWVPAKTFPGPGRMQALSFAIGERGFYGTGYNDDPDLGYLDDWWEYHNDEWIPRARFQGSRRSNSIGFALKGNGFLFTGIGRVVQNDIPTKVIMADGWRYVPLK